MTTEDRRSPDPENPDQQAEAKKEGDKKPDALEAGGEAPVVSAGDTVEFEAVTEPSEEAPTAKKKAPAPESEESKGLKHKIKKKDAELKALKKEIEELKKGREEQKDIYLRKLADIENLRKRLEREMADFRLYALSGLLIEMLDVVDNFERALATANETNGKAYQEGVEMIYRQLMELLRRTGVTPILMQDRKFDPSRQQAVLTEESEKVQEPEVAEELQRGYFLHNRLLRPAMVKVLIPKKG